MHSIRVKHIQEEYQKYMERVRGKAQAAIDQANSQYQSSRNMLTARVDALVHFLQTRHLQVCLCSGGVGIGVPWHQQSIADVVSALQTRRMVRVPKAVGQLSTPLRWLRC